MRTVFTENPEEELWRHLSGFMYATNVERYLHENGLRCSLEKAEEISTFFQQAQEYFGAAKSSSMQISPLLLYYGTVNLYSALRSLKGEDSTIIVNHGMRQFVPPDSSKVGDIQVNILSGQGGGFHEYLTLFQNTEDISEINRWRLSEILSSIPDMYEDYITSSVYPREDVRLIPIDIDLNNKYEMHRITREAYNILPVDFDIKSEVVNYRDAYLNPNKLQDGSLILRLKIDPEDVTVGSLSGRRYLRRFITHGNSKGFLSTEIAYLMSLYLLGVISRYKPSVWNPFASRDNTGERRIIERFLLTSRRVIPNLVINKIENKTIIFTNQQYVAKNPPPLSADDVKEIVRESIKTRGV